MAAKKKRGATETASSSSMAKVIIKVPGRPARETSGQAERWASTPLSEPPQTPDGIDDGIDRSEEVSGANKLVTMAPPESIDLTHDMQVSHSETEPANPHPVVSAPSGISFVNHTPSMFASSTKRTSDSVGECADIKPPLKKRKNKMDTPTVPRCKGYTADEPCDEPKEEQPHEFTVYVQVYQMSTEKKPGRGSKTTTNLSFVSKYRAPPSSPGTMSHNISLTEFCAEYRISANDEAKLAALEYQPGDRAVERLEEREWRDISGLTKLGWERFLDAHHRFCHSIKSRQT